MTIESTRPEAQQPKGRLIRTRRLAGVLLVAAVSAAATATGMAVAGPSDDRPASVARPEGQRHSLVAGLDDDVAETGIEGDGENVEGGGTYDVDEGAQEPEPEPAEPDEKPDPDDGDPDEPVAPAALSVPTNMSLKAGTYTGSFTIANVGGQNLSWKAWPDPGVTVSLDSGSLAGGEQVVVSFTIDSSELQTGAFKRRIMIDAPDVGAKDLWVEGTKPVTVIVGCEQGQQGSC